MTLEAWQDLVESIKEQFPVEDQRTEEKEDGEGSIEIIEFDGPLGLMKLALMTRSKVVGKKITAARRAGAEGKEENVYDDTQTITTLKAYRWEEEAEIWQELEADKLDF